MMHRNRSVNVHHFSMTPRPDIPRAAFDIQHAHKTTFDAGFLIPIYCEEVLPGDSWTVRCTAFARLATPIFPLMDNLYLDTFFFYVPNRLVWDNWVRFMGEQDNPTDSISYVVPSMGGIVGGYAVGSVYDYFGLGTVGQVTGPTPWSHSALPLRMYNLIWNQWFRDENLQNSVIVRKSDGGDGTADYNLLRRGKRADYFTTCLPWPQKGAAGVTVPLVGGSAPVLTSATDTVTGVRNELRMRTAATGNYPASAGALGLAAGNGQTLASTTGITAAGAVYPANLFADLSQATGTTINVLRQSFQIQKLLERDARGGTRYVELIQSHFGVRSPDARLDRPEYLGGGSSPIILNPIAQQSATGVTGGSTPLGSLGAVGTSLGNHGFRQSFVEHGYVIGLASVRADLTYQQGLRRHWSRRTKHDYYWPAFAMLGEQAVLNKEIFLGGDALDDVAFGFQERWSEYRYAPSQVTGLFRSTSAGTLDAWHLAQRFATRPGLNATFIQETPPLSRVLAVGGAANGAQIIFDSFWSNRAVRPLPLYSVPGLIDHF
jgi:hypothetical protein